MPEAEVTAREDRVRYVIRLLKEDPSGWVYESSSPLFLDEYIHDTPVGNMADVAMLAVRQWNHQSTGVNITLTSNDVIYIGFSDLAAPVNDLDEEDLLVALEVFDAYLVSKNDEELVKSIEDHLAKIAVPNPSHVGGDSEAKIDK